MSKDKNNLFIDFDGTIVDITDRHYATYIASMASVSDAKPIGKDLYWRLKRRDAQWNEILSINNTSHLENEFIRKFIDTIETMDMLRMDKLFKGARKFINRVKPTNNVYLVSLRRNHSNLLRQLEYLGMDDTFDKVLSGHSDTKAGSLLKKADVIRGVGLHVQGVMIGDTEADIVASKELGFRTIAVTSGIRDSNFLRQYLPDELVADIGAINTSML